MHNLWKTKGSNSPWDLYWGKQNIQAKKVYSSTSRGVGATSSPGRFSLAFEMGREKRPGDEVGVGGACESWLISGYQQQTGKLQHPQAISYRLCLLRISSVFLSSETPIWKVWSCCKPTIFDQNWRHFFFHLSVPEEQEVSLFKRDISSHTVARVRRQVLVIGQSNQVQGLTVRQECDGILLEWKSLQLPYRYNWTFWL